MPRPPPPPSQGSRSPPPPSQGSRPPPPSSQSFGSEAPPPMAPEPPEEYTGRASLPCFLQKDIIAVGDEEERDVNANVMKEGYVMRRNGVGLAATHYWDVRFCVVSPDAVRFFTDQSKENQKGLFRTKLVSGVSVCFQFARETYNEGRKRFLFGVASKGNPAKPSFVLDAESDEVRQSFLKAFQSCGASLIPEIQAQKKDQSSVKEGWLVKKGLTWHRRYVCLLPQMIVYYKQKGDKHPGGVVPISKATKMCDATAGGLVTRKHVLMIQAEHSDKSVYFQCNDQLQFDVWMAALEKLTAGAATGAN